MLASSDGPALGVKESSESESVRDSDDRLIQAAIEAVHLRSPQLQCPSTSFQKCSPESAGGMQGARDNPRRQKTSQFAGCCGWFLRRRRGNG
eukprot:SAG31_NODE_1580_length_7835_cov_4.074457_6_plen_92_part_00